MIRTEDKYTSLKLSKLLKEGGCELESKRHWLELTSIGHVKKDFPEDWHVISSGKFNKKFFKKTAIAFDIMNDICIKYKKEFFGEEYIETGIHGEMTWSEKAYKVRSRYVLELLQKGDKPGAEKYIWDNCKLNPANK